jgi:ABC-type dipeptide/oligopeptide/nickel transport system ATPase component
MSTDADALMARPQARRRDQRREAAISDATLDRGGHGGAANSNPVNAAPLGVLGERFGVSATPVREAMPDLAKDVSEVAERNQDRVRRPLRMAGTFPSEVSKDDRQRVAMMRALSGKPDALVCDQIRTRHLP